MTDGKDSRGNAGGEICRGRGQIYLEKNQDGSAMHHPQGPRYDREERFNTLHEEDTFWIGYRIGCRIGAHCLNAESTKLVVNGQAEQARRAQSMPEVLKARKGAQRAR